MANDDKKKKFTTKEFVKEFEVKDKTVEKVKIKVKSMDIEVPDKSKDSDTLTAEFEAKVLKGKDKISEDIDKKGEDRKIKLTYKKGTWTPHFEVEKVDGLEVASPKDVKIPVKGNLHIWPTWTCIIVGGLLLAGIASWLIWSLLKKDGDEE